MAKTLEELKEGIQNVIVENNKGEITAKSLNMLLTDMADTLSELGGSGGGQFDLYANVELVIDDDESLVVTTTDEQKELNKIVMDKIVNGERAPLVLHLNDIDYEAAPYKVNISGTCVYVALMKDVQAGVLPVITSKNILQFMCYGAEMVGGNGILVLLEDGDIFAM